MFHDVLSRVYWIFTDFMVNLANLLGISYVEANFLLFLVVLPAVTLLLLSLTVYQGVVLVRLKRRALKAEPHDQASPPLLDQEAPSSQSEEEHEGDPALPAEEASSSARPEKRWRRRALVVGGTLGVLGMALAGVFVYRVMIPCHAEMELLPFYRGSCFVQNPIFWVTGRCYAQLSMRNALEEAASRLGRLVPGAHVAYLDASGAHGGKLLGHLSHEHGLDVDILYLWRDPSGRLYPRVPSLFKVGYRLKCNRKGRCGALAFDRSANLALVLALLRQDAAEVEKIFVEPFIQAWLLEEAVEQGLQPSEMERLRKKLRYAGDNAAPHTDHMHVRFELPELSGRRGKGRVLLCEASFLPHFPFRLALHRSYASAISLAESSGETRPVPVARPGQKIFVTSSRCLRAVNSAADMAKKAFCGGTGSGSTMVGAAIRKGMRG